jgi:hypothetical protein
MQNSDSFVHSSSSLPDISARRTVRQLWWASQEFYIIVTTPLDAHMFPFIGEQVSKNALIRIKN